MLCPTCTKRVAAYNRARYQKALKPWPAKSLCRKCRAGLRETRRVWRAAWVSAHREQVVQAQRDYRARLKRAV